jgi:hypothetical protein
VNVVVERSPHIVLPQATLQAMGGGVGRGFICILDIPNIEAKPHFPIQVVPEQDQILHL